MTQLDPPANGLQQDLLEKAEMHYDWPRWESLMQAIDKLAVWQSHPHPYQQRHQAELAMLHDMFSPRYTTHWEDLLRIKADIY